MEIDKIFLDNFTQAENLYKENKLLESLKKYQKLYNQNPKHISVLNNIGLIHEQLEDYKEAIRFYERCNKLLPNEIILISNLANVYCKTERYLDALPLLKKIIHSDYQNETNCEKFALCLFETQNKEETKKFLETAISKFPKNNLLNGLFGKTLLHLNLHRDGLKHLQQCTGIIEFNDNGVKYLS